MNYALLIMILSVSMFWVSDGVLGTDQNRDVVAALAILFAFANTGRYILPALRAFRRGGMQDNWQLLMGNVLFWSGFGCREIWAWLVRDAERPLWMIHSPLNGFFAFWILGGGILCWHAGQRTLMFLPEPHKLYVYSVLVALGALLGAALYRYLGAPLA